MRNPLSAKKTSTEVLPMSSMPQRSQLDSGPNVSGMKQCENTTPAQAKKRKPSSAGKYLTRPEMLLRLAGGAQLRGSLHALLLRVSEDELDVGRALGFDVDL